jgi:xanthine dehydrogenase YagS FAD-binding subunit
VALGATARIVGKSGERTVPLDKFFVLPRQDVTKENVLLPDEILTEIQVPNAPAGSKAIYVKEMVREVWDFALCSVAAMVTVQNGVVQDVRIVLGGVAPIPYRALKAEAAIKGKPLNEASAAAAGLAAVDGAKPLAKNGYKVPLTQAVVKRALLSLA